MDQVWEALAAAEGYATALSVLAAIATWWLSNRRNIRFERRLSTVNVLLSANLNDDLHEANLQMSRFVRAGEKIVHEGLADDVDAKVMRLLNFYEFVATAVVDRYLDFAATDHLRGGAMCEAHDVCEDYIRARSEWLRRPELYANLRMLCDPAWRQQQGGVKRLRPPSSWSRRTRASLRSSTAATGA